LCAYHAQIGVNGKSARQRGGGCWKSDPRHHTSAVIVWWISQRPWGRTFSAEQRDQRVLFVVTRCSVEGWGISIRGNWIFESEAPPLQKNDPFSPSLFVTCILASRYRPPNSSRMRRSRSAAPLGNICDELTHKAIDYCFVLAERSVSDDDVYTPTLARIDTTHRDISLGAGNAQHKIAYFKKGCRWLKN